MLMTRLALALAVAVAFGAASPARLDAQRRQPTGIPRPVPPLGQWSENCAAQKLMIVGGMTVLGWVVGFMTTIVAMEVALLSHGKWPGSKIMAGGTALGLAAGVVVAVIEPCRIRDS